MVRVSFLENEPVILAAVAAKISRTPFEKGTIEDIYKESRENREKSIELVNRIMRESGHMIFGDFLPYAITLENISRFAAIYFWRNVNCYNLVFGAGIEASFRVVKPNRYKEIVSDFGKEAFEVYQKLIELGIPEQDARYILPEGTLTRMIFSAPPRYLVKLATALKKTPLSELQEIGKKIGALVRDKFGLEVPEETLPSEWKFWGREEIEEGINIDYKITIHSLSLNMAIKGSLAMYAQLVRQRQNLCDIEPLEGIAQKARFVVPPTFSEDAKEYYREIAISAHRKQMELIKNRDPSFVYFLLLGQEAQARIFGKGAGVIEISRARSEGVAQWEIRNVVGIPITKELAKYQKFQKEIGPRCWREGKCIEPATFKTKKNVCPIFAKGWQGKNLEELLELLQKSYQTFEL